MVFLAPDAAGLGSRVLTGQSLPRFTAGVEVITVPVTVRHEDRNDVIPSLGAADFRLMEDGQAQRVSFVERDTRPLSLALVFDSSASVDFLTAAVLALVSDLRSQYLIGYETARPLDGRYRRIKVESTARNSASATAAATLRSRLGEAACPWSGRDTAGQMLRLSG
jgi:hypothetical protein